MRTSEKYAAVAAAFMAARLDMPTLKKRGNNPDTNSKYIKFDDMVPIVVRTFAKHSILINQSAELLDRAVRVVTRFTLLVPPGAQRQDVPAEWMEMEAAVPLAGRMKSGGGRHDPDPQAAGSAISYARRYGLAAAVMLVADEDDDGRAARAPEPQARPAAQRAERPAGNKAIEKRAGGEFLAKARAYVPGSFVAPAGTAEGQPFGKMTPEELTKWLDYAKKHTLNTLVDDLEFTLADRAAAEVANGS